jgi:uncharacterized YccA/Bax inhibitor family protein
MQTANPALSDNFFGRHAASTALPMEASRRMSVQGTFNKTLLLLGVVVLTAAWTWWRFLSSQGAPEAVQPLLWGGLIGGLVLSLVILFKPTTAPYLAPLYAAAQGLFLGGLSSILDLRFPGIVLPAVGLTFGIFFVMLILYSSGTLRATPAFTKGVVAATIGVGLVYLASWVLGMFGVRIPYIHEGGLIGIGFSLFVVGLAALNLVLDFAMIERGAARGAPKHMEWYGGFALLVTLVWLYIEVLRLLAKMQSRR